MDRPRRSTRLPNKSPQLIAPKSSTRIVKRRSTPEPIAPEVQLKTLLESSKSDLVSREMSEIINMSTWLLLSSEEQTNLKALLPPTAFLGASESIGNDHPSAEDDMVVDNDTPSELHPGFFNDPHLLAACRTFQDHLYLNWFSESHTRKVAKFQQGITDGTMAAPWKDEVWERDNPVPEVPTVASMSSFTLAGASTEVKLSTLVKNNLLRVGDVLAYRRGFAGPGIMVEKDCIIDFVHPKTYALDIRTLPGTARDLPAELLMASQDVAAESSTNEGFIQTMTISSPTMLETALLDLDGRIEKSRRPNGNAWKTFTVWRWRAGGEYQPYDSRGGRENHGTLFYIRGSHHQEA